MILAAQADRARLAIVILLGGIEAVEVGFQRALLLLGACRLVEGQLAGGHQQGGETIHQSRFATADVAGQQAVVALYGQMPDLLIEGAPVEHLETHQAKALQGWGRQGGLGREWCVQLTIHSAFSCVCSSA